MQDGFRGSQLITFGEADESDSTTVEGRSTAGYLGRRLHRFTAFSPAFICRLKPSAEAMTARTTVNLIIILRAVNQVCDCSHPTVATSPISLRAAVTIGEDLFRFFPRKIC